MESSAFYTMKGYELAADAQITTAMEDYLEMICRLEEEEADPSASGPFPRSCMSSPHPLLKWSLICGKKGWLPPKNMEKFI